jgi:hypothetical protein
MFKSICTSVFGLAIALILGTSLSASTISYTFDDGTNQGWTNIDLKSPSTGNQWVWTAETSIWFVSPYSGSYAVGQSNYVGPDSGADTANSTRIFRSPEFTFVSTDTIDATVYLVAGSGGAASLSGNVADLQAESSSTGFMGVALRDVTTGTYVASVHLSPPYTTTWSPLSFDLSSIDRSHTYTLDLVDAFHGSWGWVGMDSVTLTGASVAPVPEPAAITMMIAGVIGLLAYAWRKRK